MKTISSTLIKNQMKKIEIKISKTVEIPEYIKSSSGIHLYKIISSDQAIQVSCADCCKSLSLVHSEVAISGGWVISSKEEFDAQFAEVQFYLLGL